MKKTLFITTVICLVFLFGIVALNVLYFIKNNHKMDVITQKETALKIGRAVLEEYSETYWKHPFEGCLDATETDDIWIVYNKSEDSKTDNKKYVTLGGGIYIEIRKSNGEILKIKVED